MWRDTLGINMELRQVEWKVYLSSHSHLDYDAGARRAGLAITTMRTLFWACFISDNGNNRTGWKNARYDALVDEANEQTDLKQREQLFQQAETMLVRDEMPIIPLYFYVGHQLLRHEQDPGHLPEHSGRPSVADCIRKMKPAVENKMYFLKRITFAVPLLLVISALAFALVHLAPGGPFDRERAPASPEIERNLKAKYHLDEPVWKQYLPLPRRSGARRFWRLAQIPQPHRQRHHRAGIAGFDDAGRAGVLLRHGRRLAGRISSPRPGADAGRIMSEVFWPMLAVCVPAFVVAPILILAFSIKMDCCPSRFGNRRGT